MLHSVGDYVNISTEVVCVAAKAWGQVNYLMECCVNQYFPAASTSFSDTVSNYPQ